MTKQKKHLLLYTCFISIILLTSLIPTYAQENSTATPAPSKTPNAAEKTPVLTQAPTITAKPLTRPFTQADFNIITANTQRPNGVVWHSDKLYTACSGDWTIYEIDAETGETAQYIYGVRNAHTLYASDGETGLSLWIPDFQTDTLVNIVQGATRNISTELSGPWGIAPLNSETFAITNLRGNNVVTVTQDGEVTEIISALRSPTGIAIDNDYLYIANTGSARRAIEWYSIKDITEENRPIDSSEAGQPLVTGLQNTTNIVTANDGLLYFAYALGTRGVIGRVDPNLCITKNGCGNDEIEIVAYTELAVPLAGLTISPDMRLYVHSMFSPDLYWLQLPTTN